jgi:two-component system phosphate regulon sensor histidine kinase PhoR
MSLSLLILLLCLLLALACFIILRLRSERVYLLYELRRTQRAEASNVENHQHELLWRRAAFEQADAALIVTDQAKTLLAINPAAERLFGSVPPASSAITLLRHHALEELLDTALAGQQVSDHLISVGTRDFQVKATRWGQGDHFQGAVMVLRDITDRQRLTRARRDFAANISHELRTPLSSLKILIETLAGGALENPPFAARLVTKLARETEAMIRLVEDMTTLGLIESGRTPLRLEPIPLAGLVHERVARLTPHTDLKNVTIREQVRPHITALLDPERFGQVLTNLLDNAIKFAPDGGMVMVRADTNATRIRLEVEDNGPGLAPADLPRVFERFYKSDSSRDRSASGDRGTGLGLAIAKHLVEAHGGHIWAESPPGRGACFIIELPADPVRSGQACPEPPPAGVPQRGEAPGS